MKVFSLPPNRSDVLLLALLLVIGFIPIGLNVLFFSLGDDEWFRVWYNESLAWGLFLVIFNMLAVFRSIYLFRWAPLFCGGVTVAAVFGICIVIVAVIHNGLGPSSKEDSPRLEMSEFWRTGGGWLTWLIILPLGVAYLALRAREQRREVK